MVLGAARPEPKALREELAGKAKEAKVEEAKAEEEEAKAKAAAEDTRGRVLRSEGIPKTRRQFPWSGRTVCGLVAFRKQGL